MELVETKSEEKEYVPLDDEVVKPSQNVFTGIAGTTATVGKETDAANI